MTATENKPPRRKGAEKNTDSASASQRLSGELPLPGTPAIPQPIPAFARAEEFCPLTDAELRRIQQEVVPSTLNSQLSTPTEWFPKPVLSKWNTRLVIAGLLARAAYREQAGGRDGLPASYDSMQALENSPLGIPKEFTKWSLKNGAGDAQLGGSRIDPRPVLRKAAEILKLIPTGSITGIDGIEEWNTSRELAKKIRLETENLADEKLLRRGEMLFSKDGTFAVTELVADELLWEKRDQPLRDLLLKLPQTVNRQHKTILAGEKPLPEKVKQCAQVLNDSVASLLAKLRSKIPKRLSETDRNAD